MAIPAADTSKEVTMKSGFKSLVLAGLLAGAGFATFAQPAGQDTARSPMMGASSPMHQGGPMGMHGRMDRSKMDSMVARHLSGLKAKLKLTAEQEGAWTTFTAAMKPPVNMGQSRPDRAEMDKLSTPERIDRMRALRTQRMADMTPPRRFTPHSAPTRRRCLTPSTPAWAAAMAMASTGAGAPAKAPTNPRPNRVRPAAA
jgi:protein CpxP